MTEEQDVTPSESKAVKDTAEQGHAIRPPVDIFEDETGITLQADMPGVSKERLDIQIDNEMLSIEGYAEISMPEGMEALHADISSTLYQRNFSLSGELDSEKVDASLKDGVLILRIPKREQFKPRKIEVRVG